MRNVVRGLAVWALCAVQLGCGQEELSPTPPETTTSALTADEAAEPTPSLLGAFDVGVLAPASGCPGSAPNVWIHMDNEDSRQASFVSGWTGATSVNGSGNTTLSFCRVDGTSFRPLQPSPSARGNYAVLKLGASCPADSVEFGRHFDNEDRNTMNSNSGNIAPNHQDGNTTLYFCLFRGASSHAANLPLLGFEYGVFATFNFGFGGGAGTIFTDDEDTRNANGYIVNSAWQWDAKALVTDGGNTYMYVARAGQVSCGDNVCNGVETEMSCPADCTSCGNGTCGPWENANSCAYDCGTCGDGTCGHNEDAWSCRQDCDVCGNNICGPGETVESCPWDCGMSCLREGDSTSGLIPPPCPNQG